MLLTNETRSRQRQLQDTPRSPREGFCWLIRAFYCRIDVGDFNGPVPVINEDTVEQKQRGESGVTLRAMLIGLVVTALIDLWVHYAELVLGGTRGHTALVNTSIPVGPFSVLFALVFLNIGLTRIAPGLKLSLGGAVDDIRDERGFDGAFKLRRNALPHSDHHSRALFLARNCAQRLVRAVPAIRSQVDGAVGYGRAERLLQGRFDGESPPVGEADHGLVRLSDAVHYLHAVHDVHPAQAVGRARAPTVPDRYTAD